jgi:FixJ family two-component response regulator
MTDSVSTFFLVDDDSGVLKALSRLLRARGYEVQPFTWPPFLASHTNAHLIGKIRNDRERRQKHRLSKFPA